MASELILQRPGELLSLPEVHGTIAASRSANPLRRLLAFVGPGYLVAVGYMDPGNWATDLAGGSAFGYTLLSVILISNLMIAVCFAVEIALARPDWAGVAAGFVPSPEVLADPAMLYIAIGILGATVMPHNLYLHSSIVQTRNWAPTPSGRRDALRFATIDSTVALSFALFVNAAILILAAAAFHSTGQTGVAEIQDAYRLLAPTLGVAVASTLFALALLASGQNSTITATLAGQIVMEGFLRLRLPPWLRRIVTRLVAIVPVVIVAWIYGESGTAQMLVLSQVVLSLQLPFAVVPLVRFTTDRRLMGELVAPRWVAVLAWVVTAVIISLNAKLLLDVATGG
jgi:manganese transport protein